MSDIASAPYAPDQEQKLAIVALVLESYKAVMARSRNEREAFETAIRTYRAHNLDLPTKEARRAVADIICGRERSAAGNAFSE